MPKINDVSRKMVMGVDLVDDAKRRQTTKKQITDMMSQKKQNDKGEAQISSQSDKFMYERFDQDFNAACQEINLLPDITEGMDANELDVGISCAQMSMLFLNLGFIRPDGRD